MRPYGAVLIVIPSNYQGHLGLSVKIVEKEAIAGIHMNIPDASFHSPCAVGK